MRFQDSGGVQILPPPPVQFKLYQGQVFQYKAAASDPRSVLLRDSCRPGALGGAMSAPAGGAAAPAATGAADRPTDQHTDVHAPGTTARRGRESGTHSPPHGLLAAALFAQWQD